jgi:predicted site-specific integrase-resolvase
MATLPQRQIAAARLQQIERVNAARPAPSDDVQTIEDLYADMRRQRDELLNQVRALQLQYDAARDQLDARKRPAKSGGSDGMLINGRLVLTCTAVSHNTGASIATINRYLNTGYWRGSRDASGRWLIEADQPFTRKEKKKKARSDK